MTIGNIKLIKTVVGAGLVLVLLSVASSFAIETVGLIEYNGSLPIFVVAIGFIGGTLMFIGLAYYWVKYYEALGEKDDHTKSKNPWD